MYLSIVLRSGEIPGKQIQIDFVVAIVKEDGLAPVAAQG